jgi:hypothetical protein
MRIASMQYLVGLYTVCMYVAAKIRLTFLILFQNWSEISRSVRLCNLGTRLLELTNTVLRVLPQAFDNNCSHNREIVMSEQV